MPSSLKRAFVHTGSHTISMFTCFTPGSCIRRVRMSSMIKSMAGQPMAVNVSLRSTIPSCCLRSTIRPISTTLIGISGSITSRRASHKAGQELSIEELVCKDGYVVVMPAAPDHTYWFSFRQTVKINTIVYHYLLILVGQSVGGSCHCAEYGTVDEEFNFCHTNIISSTGLDGDGTATSHNSAIEWGSDSDV